MIKGLPLEFKLFMKKKYVGYMKIDIGHVVTKKIDCLAIYLSKDGENWSGRIYPHQVRSCMAPEIIFDEIRQYTGFNAKNGKICLGDKLKAEYEDEEIKILTVRFSKFGDIQGVNNGQEYGAINFEDMELIDETP